MHDRPRLLGVEEVHALRELRADLRNRELLQCLRTVLWLRPPTTQFVVLISSANGIWRYFLHKVFWLTHPPPPPCQVDSYVLECCELPSQLRS